MNDKSTVQRSFVPGDSWLYYKIYTGHKTADQVLAEVVKPFTENMLHLGEIDKWFFIRYADPEFHLRIRFSFKRQGSLAKVIAGFNEMLLPMVDNEIVWNVQLEDYHREIERYGHNSMEEAESLFLYDSEFVVQLLNMVEGREGEELRWLLGLRGIDSLLDAFGYTLEEKLLFSDKIRAGFAREFGMSRFLKKQLDAKYRTHRKRIDQFLTLQPEQDHELAPLLQLLLNREERIRPIAGELRDMDHDEILQLPMGDLMSSYVHMYMNRLFRSQNRKYELVIYDFLHRTYASKQARLKHQNSK